MSGEWESAERVQKNSAGEYRALIGGEWISVEKAQKNAQGQFRVMRSGGMSNEDFQAVKREGNVVKPPEMFTPSGEKPTPSFSDPYFLRAHPLVRFAEGAASPLIGAGQLSANVYGLGGPVNEFLSSSEKQADDARRQLGSEGVDFWKLGGSIASPAVLGAMKIPMAESVVGRMGQGAAIGAGFGAASPVTNPEDFWGRKASQVGFGAALGGALPLGIEGVTAVGRLGRNIIDPILPGGHERGAARILAEAAGPKRAAIEAELAKNQTLVPGSLPTGPEAAARAGSPEFSALQRIASDHRPSAYSDIAKAQELARQNAIRAFGGTKADVRTLEKVREITGKKNYGDVAEDLIASDPFFKRLLDRPSMDKAMARAKELAEEESRAFSVGKDAPAQRIPSTILNESGQPAFSTTVAGTSAQYPVKSMQYLKMAMDDLISNPERFGIGASEARAIGSTQKEFIAWLNSKSTGWKRAREVYAAQSKPINELQVGQQLEDALTKPIGEGERAGVFAGAMKEAPRTIKKATGQSRYEDLDEVLQPQNLAAVKSVLADLARKAEFERLVPLGRSKAAEAAMPFGLPATGPLNQSYMIFKTVLGRVTKGINEKTLDTMADALQVPADTLRLLQKAPSAQQQKMIDQIISAKIGRGAVAASSEMFGEGVNQR